MSAPAIETERLACTYADVLRNVMLRGPDPRSAASGGYVGKIGGESSSLALMSVSRGRNDQLVSSNESPYMMYSPKVTKVKYSEDVD